MVRMLRRRRRAGGERGATLVEFALISPLLFLIVFGTIEFGFLFLQNLDVRSGTREGARLAAVNGTNSTATNAELKTQTLTRMDSSSGVNIWFQRTGLTPGNTVRVCIEKPFSPVTHFLDFAVNNVTLRSKVDIRLEQDATWNADPAATIPSWCGAP
jgi:hypothetical protein